MRRPDHPDEPPRVRKSPHPPALVEDQVSGIFRALGNPTRRQVVEALVHGPASVSDLAEPHGMALPSFLQHLKVLEEAGGVRSEKEGRIRTFELVPDRLNSVEGWLQRQRFHWESRLDRFDAYVRKLSEEER